MQSYPDVAYLTHGDDEHICGIFSIAVALYPNKNTVHLFDRID